MNFNGMANYLEAQSNPDEQRAAALALANGNGYYTEESMGQLFDSLTEAYGATHVKVLDNGVIVAGKNGSDMLLINTAVDPSNTSLVNLYGGQGPTCLNCYEDFAGQFFGDNPPAGIVSIAGQYQDHTGSAVRAYGVLEDIGIDGVVQVGFSYGSAKVFDSTESLLANYENAPVRYIVSIDPIGTNLIKSYNLDRINKEHIPTIMLLQEKAAVTGKDYINNFGEITGQVLKNNPNFDFRNFIITVPETSVAHEAIPHTITENGYLETLAGLKDGATGYDCRYYRVRCDENGTPIYDPSTNLPMLEEMKNIDIAVTLRNFTGSNGGLITSCAEYVADRMSAINTYATTLLNDLSASLSIIGSFGLESSLFDSIQSCLSTYCSSFSNLASKISDEVAAINSYAKGYEDVDIDLSNLTASIGAAAANSLNGAIADGPSVSAGGGAGGAGNAAPANTPHSPSSTPEPQKTPIEDSNEADNKTPTKITDSETSTPDSQKTPSAAANGVDDKTPTKTTDSETSTPESQKTPSEDGNGVGNAVSSNTPPSPSSTPEPQKTPSGGTGGGGNTTSANASHSSSSTPSSPNNNNLVTETYKGIYNRSYVISHDNNGLKEFKELFKFPTYESAAASLPEIQKEFSNMDVNVFINNENNVEVVFNHSLFDGKTLEQVKSEFMRG